MTETPNTDLLNLILSRGQELIDLSTTTYIFRAEIAYLSQHIRSFISTLKKIKSIPRNDEKMTILKQILELFDHYRHVLSHLQHDKWIQPAINWPTRTIPDYIEEFRKSLERFCISLGLDPSNVITFDIQQDGVNRIDDLRQLRSSVASVLEKADTSDNVGLPEQIETKLQEIDNLLPVDRSSKLSRRPSSASLPMVQMQHRVEELLVKYKNINIPLEDIRIEEQIGSGGFGTVAKATRLSTAEVVAVKELRSDRLTLSSWASLYAEIETMATVKCNFVLDLVGAHITEPYRIITRFFDGKSLFDRLHRPSQKYPMPPPTQMTVLAYEVACGMDYLHQAGIVHRDLKTPNILLDSNGDCCVADFGLSGILPDSKELIGGVGTPNYTAPEVLSKQRYGPKVDVYSFGIVLWEMLTHRVPFSDMTQIAIYEHVVTRGWRLPIPADCPDGLKKLIIRCWSKNPADRPEFAEIITLFENFEALFPGSEHPDYEQIKQPKRSPNLNLEYAISVLANPTNEHFPSMVLYIVTKMTDGLRDTLRSRVSIMSIAKTKTNSGAVLLLASQLLYQNEFAGFMTNTGIDLFKTCVETQKGPAISMAMHFGFAVPKDLLPSLECFLPDIIAYLVNNYGAATGHILQFLTRFSTDILEPYRHPIAKTLLDICAKIEDQATFDSIVALMPLVSPVLTLDDRRKFYHLISDTFSVSPIFVDSLLNEQDEERRCELLCRLFKASVKSDLTDVVLKFIQQCPQEILLQAVAENGFITTCDTLLLDPTKEAAPLLFMFRVASSPKMAEAIANPISLERLTQGKERRAQRLMILTLLAMNEKFCLFVKDSASLFQLLIAALGSKSLVHHAVRLIGAFSTHHTGCAILTDSGILDIFTQVFLSSQSSDTATTHTILRNLARHGCEIPQITLIVSCLMQDLTGPAPNRVEIMDTIVALVETRPSSVQEHDLLRVAVHQLREDDPTIVYLSLKLLSVADPVALRNVYPQALIGIHELLNKESNHYPEIIEVALQAIENIAQQSDLREYIEKTELVRFVNEIIDLLPDGDSRREYFAQLLEQVQITPILPDLSTSSFT